MSGPDGRTGSEASADDMQAPDATAGTAPADEAVGGTAGDGVDSVRLDLLSTSRATDAAYLAAADIAAVAAELDAPYRLIGGNCVTLLVAVHQVDVPPRDTADADLGASYQVVGDPRLPVALLDRGYVRTEGNRFERPYEDTVGGLQLAVDILAPAYEARMQTSQPHGDLFVDEVPGLAMALARNPVIVEVGVRLTSGDQVGARLLLPDPVSALCMKAVTWDGRHAARDAVDIWRLLETAYAAGVRAAAWPRGGSGLDAARVLHRSFASAARNPYRDAQVPGNVPVRVRALIGAVVAPPER